MRKVNKKGFTLIELLAVIIILGLLMAIAIPSVTKYITQSRKKTITSTIGNYIGALVKDVNDLTYTFTKTNTVYAVPIECIALERGGTNPFGHWLHANDSYWAYVLVQYDDQTSSYTYGYTFKDSAGYGIYPTAQSKLNEQEKQIQTGLSLSRPTNGKITTITSSSNWSGFKVNDGTDLKVLLAAPEGTTGDGKTTCTMQQKGDNYNNAQQGNSTELPKVKTLAGTTWKFNNKIINYENFKTFDYDTQNGWDYFPDGTIISNGDTSYEVWILTEYDVFGLKLFATVHSVSVMPYMFAYYPDNDMGIEPGWYLNDHNAALGFLTGNITDPNAIYDAITKTTPPTITFSSETNSTLENQQLIDLMYENATMQ